MKNMVLALVALISLAMLGGCDGELQHTSVFNDDSGEYLTVKIDQRVSGNTCIDRIGYSLTSRKDGRVVYTFQYAPKKMRLEDYDGDGVKDLVYVVPDQSVRGDAIYIVYSMRVALGKGDGNFRQSKVVQTFDSLK